MRMGQKNDKLALNVNHLKQVCHFGNMKGARTCLNPFLKNLDFF